MYSPVKSLFLSQDRYPAPLRQLFKSPVKKVWLLFTVTSHKLFTSSIKQIGEKEISAVVSAEKLKNLETLLQARHDANYF